MPHDAAKTILRSFSPSTISSADDGAAHCEDDNARVESYGVVWQLNSRPTTAGKLEFDLSRLHLEGIDFAYACSLRELTGVRVGRDNDDRLDGRPVLLLERSNGDTIRVASLSQAGVVCEIAERLATLEIGPRAA